MNKKTVILVVDDSPASLTMAARILEAAGYTTRQVLNGELAVASAMSDPPDLILLDIRMPGKDGFSVFRDLQSSEACRRVPVIFLSGTAEVKDRIEGLKLGAVDYIAKPYHTEELLVRVETHLALARARSALERQAAQLGKANAHLHSEIIKRRQAEEELRQNFERAENSHQAMLAALEEQKRMERQLLRAQRLESVGALAGGIAHDLNNILAPIMMIVPFLRKNIPDAESQEMLDTIGGCALRGSGIIKQLLAFARGAPGERVPLPMAVLLREMDKIIRETFPRDIVSRTRASEDLWVITGDATQIHQAILNLCVNARDAMANGGTLTVHARNIIVDEAMAATTPDANTGPFVCVAVSDTGTGIDPGILDRIFDPFFTTKETGKGTGLGLSTALGIVRGHKGFMRVRSQPGQGATFELYFPASIEAQTPPETGNEPPSVPGQGELVLVIDDEPSVLDCMSRALEYEGYRVVTATQGIDGLEVFSRRRDEIRVVITDIMMPVMNGSIMITALRAIDPRLAIIGISGMTDPSCVKEVDQLHLNAFLIKPFNCEDLLRALNGVLQPREPAMASEGVL